MLSLFFYFWGLQVKVFFSRKCIKIIYIFLKKKKLFLILAHQNDLKTPRNINLKKK